MDVLTRMVTQQRDFFHTGKTLPYAFRLTQLKKLKAVVRFYESEIIKALHQDLNKSEFEAYATELGVFYKELNYTIRHLKKWMHKKRKQTPLVHQPASSYVYPKPFGVVLILSPWNYPFLLALQPLVGALAAGNCVTLKPSEYAPATAELLEKILLDCFDSEYVQIILGDANISSELTNNTFDYIFFTGSTDVGRHVMKAAAKNLTPVTLELGGKSPCIIDHTANLALAAKRIAWGKFTNAGQTCIAPDYILIHHSVKKRFMHELKIAIQNMYGINPCANRHYPKIINTKHFNRLIELMKDAPIYYGGKSNIERSKIEPTLLDLPNDNFQVMEDEIFGPILPIIAYSHLKNVVHYVNEGPRPLACYIFSENTRNINRLIHHIHFGGGVVNDTLIHIANHHLPFGGIGDSGMGAYHGKASFDTFSHKKSILKKANWIDLPFKYAPYKLPVNILRHLMR